MNNIEGRSKKPKGPQQRKGNKTGPKSAKRGGNKKIREKPRSFLFLFSKKKCHAAFFLVKKSDAAEQS